MANTTVRQLRLVVEAEDFEEAVAFYRDALGLDEEFVVDSEGGARVVALRAGRATLEIDQPGPAAPDRRVGGRSGGEPVDPRRLRGR